MKKTLTFLTLALLSSIAQADIYKCSKQGKTTYSDTPCSTDAKPKSLPQVSGYAALKFNPAPKKQVLASSAPSTSTSRAEDAEARKRRCQQVHELRVSQIKSNYWRPSQDPQRARAIDAAFADLMRCQR